MDREIKFRAWDEAKKAWIPGADGFHILGESMLLGGLFQDYKIEDLNNIVLMQYTGLKDKDGVEIYEGDICNFLYEINNMNEIVTVAWNPSLMGWRFENPTYISIRALTITNSGTLKVIGNIHDNPELMGDSDGKKED